MANYTVLDLAEVTDQAPNIGLPAELELRMARVPLEAQNSGISLLRLAPGFRVPYGHSHKQQEEIFVCVEGSATMNVDGDLIEMRPYVAVRVSPAGVRACQGGPDGATLIAIGAPNTGPGDGINVMGWWGE